MQRGITHTAGAGRARQDRHAKARETAATSATSGTPVSGSGPGDAQAFAVREGRVLAVLPVLTVGIGLAALPADRAVVSHEVRIRAGRGAAVRSTHVHAVLQAIAFRRSGRGGAQGVALSKSRIAARA